MQYTAGKQTKKRASQMKTMYIGIYRSRKHTHKIKNNITKHMYRRAYIHKKNIHIINNKEKIYTIEMKKKQKKTYNLHKHT